MYTFVFKFELHMGQRDIKIINQSINQSKIKKGFQASTTNLAGSRIIQDTGLCELPLGVHLHSVTDASYLWLRRVLKNQCKNYTPISITL